MNVLLTSELEEFVQEKVNTGKYQSASEVIIVALRLLEQQDRIRQMQIDKLRAEIAIGIEQGDRGEVFDGEEVVRELLEEIDQASPTMSHYMVLDRN
ncbi:MAG: type II toxin-antitoxin system ParD family antitoxin [Hormoscilla sp. GUM202]|nr:type II toxin-antitoxin system ParD family antitoxin [Hormoscilla sp. GUM202]